MCKKVPEAESTPQRSNFNKRTGKDKKTEVPRGWPLGFLVRRLATLGGERSMVEYWQTKRGGGLRGIIEIVEDRDD